VAALHSTAANNFNCSTSKLKLKNGSGRGRVKTSLHSQQGGLPHIFEKKSDGSKVAKSYGKPLKKKPRKCAIAVRKAVMHYAKTMRIPNKFKQKRCDKNTHIKSAFLSPHLCEKMVGNPTVSVACNTIGRTAIAHLFGAEKA